LGLREGEYLPWPGESDDDDDADDDDDDGATDAMTQAYMQARKKGVMTDPVTGETYRLMGSSKTTLDPQQSFGNQRRSK